MIQVQVYDVATQSHVQTMVVVNSEFYVGLIIGVILAAIFWQVAKGMSN